MYDSALLLNCFNGIRSGPTIHSFAPMGQNCKRVAGCYRPFGPTGQNIQRLHEGNFFATAKKISSTNANVAQQHFLAPLGAKGR